MASSSLGFVARLVELVDRDAPRCASAAADALGPVALVLVLDGEPVRIAAIGGHIVVTSTRGGETIGATTTSAIVLRLVDGEDELLAAIVANRVRVRSPRAHAHRLFDVVRLLVDGCARSAEGPALLDELRGHVAASGDRS